MQIRLPRGAPITLAALLLVTIGCSRITVVDTPAPSGRDLPAAPASLSVPHDLAVTGIDFDPALSTFESRPTDEVILLVVVENRGTESEHNVHLNVSLSGTSAGDLLLQAERSISELAAGQTRVERRPVHLPIALRSAYQLPVSVEPVQGETSLGNNSRVYRFQLGE